MRLAIWGAALLGAGALAVIFGIVPPADALAIADRVWPILAFVVAITIVAELATEAGLFDVIAAAMARWSRGRTWLLWLLIVALATVTTAFLSLDTTAVLLTPVVIVVAKAHSLPPLPFALTTVWLANTASLLLPVSNLTNLLSLHALGFSDAWSFVALLGPSALIAVVVPTVIAWLLHRRTLATRFSPVAAPHIADRVLLGISGGVVCALLPLLVIGVPPWIPTAAAALILAGVFAWRAPDALRVSLVPWQLVVFASGLFLVLGGFEELGSASLLSAVSGTGEDPLSLVQLAGVGAFGANAINNLPAYLALEPVAQSPARIGALLVGVNAGPLVTPWASLATLLWHARLESLGVRVRWGRFAVLGLLIAPVTVVLATLPLAMR